MNTRNILLLYYLKIHKASVKVLHFSWLWSFSRICLHKYIAYWTMDDCNPRLIFFAKPHACHIQLTNDAQTLGEIDFNTFSVNLDFSNI